MLSCNSIVGRIVLSKARPSTRLSPRSSARKARLSRDLVLSPSSVELKFGWAVSRRPVPKYRAHSAWLGPGPPWGTPTSPQRPGTYSLQVPDGGLIITTAQGGTVPACLRHVDPSNNPNRARRTGGWLYYSVLGMPVQCSADPVNLGLPIQRIS